MLPNGLNVLDLVWSKDQEDSIFLIVRHEHSKENEGVVFLYKWKDKSSIEELEEARNKGRVDIKIQVSELNSYNYLVSYNKLISCCR